MTHPPSVFPAVEPASALYDPLRRLRDAVHAEPRFASTSETSVRAELLPVRGDSGPVLRRFYWSLRREPEDSPLGFTATTMHYDASSGSCGVYEFPDEPVMQWLPETLGSHGADASVRILRYIPLRRVTYLLTGGPQLPDRVIVKTKRTSGLRRAAKALAAARAAVGTAGPLRAPFVVPRPIGVDERHRTFFLEELPGQPLSQDLARLDLGDAMARLAEVHAGVHALRVDGLPQRGIDDWVAAAETAAFQVAAFVPSLGEPLTAFLQRARRDRPVDARPGFCQGDFVPSQILCSPGAWGVLDLDDGHLADPCAEVAALYTALPRELSVADAAQAARVRRLYLESYVAVSGIPIEPARWRWFRSVSELRYLARRLVKGRALPGEAEATVTELLRGDYTAGETDEW